MPHHPKPFFVTARKVWRVQIDGRQHNLGPDEETAYKRYHALMNKPAPVVSELVLGIIEGFLTWCEKHRAGLTYVWYKARLTSFCRSLDSPTTFTVADLKPYHVEQWADSNTDWGPSQRRGAIGAVQRAFLWAEKRGHITQSPIRNIEKPEAGKRERVISQQEYAMLLERYRDEAFRSLLQLSWHTGCRPQESIRIEARHVDLQNRRVVLPPKEAKGKRRYRIIYLNDAALELVKRLSSERPVGPVFRNTKGDPWNAQAVNCRFCRLQQHLFTKSAKVELDPAKVAELASTLKPTLVEKGRERKKTPKELLREARKKLRAKAASAGGEKLCLYVFRHTFAQRLLLAGVDTITVSTLLGHVDGSMLSRVYQHLQQNGDHLLKALNKV